MTRQADAALTAKVVTLLQDDPYVFGGHISVVTENGTRSEIPSEYAAHDVFVDLDVKRVSNLLGNSRTTEARGHQVGDESEELHDCGDRLSERSQACT